MCTFLNKDMANIKLQVPFQVGKTICQLHSWTWDCFLLPSGLGWRTLHIYCLWCNMHIQQSLLYSEFLKWLSKRNSLQYSYLKSSVFDWLSWWQLENYQSICFLTQEEPLRTEVQVLQDSHSPFLTWNTCFWFLISKTWDYMLCLRFPLLDSRSHWMNSDTSCKERKTEGFGILNYQEVKEEQKLQIT